MCLSCYQSGIVGLSSCRNGGMHLVAGNAYDARLMSLNQECMSVLLAGVGKSWMMSRGGAMLQLM